VVQADATAVAPGLMEMCITRLLALSGVGIAMEIMAATTSGKTALTFAIGTAIASGFAALN